MNNVLLRQLPNNQLEYASKFVSEKNTNTKENKTALPEILFITSYPPRECGIATYSQDLMEALSNKFNNSFSIGICALEAGNEHYNYKTKPKYFLNTSCENSYAKTAFRINRNTNIEMVVIQHEFGFFSKNECAFQQFIETINKPVVIVFHTVLPNPNNAVKQKVKAIVKTAASVIVMTNSSADILLRDYQTPIEKLNVIPHGTHLVPRLNKPLLKIKYNLADRKVLSTFGLLSSGKSIETTLDALTQIVEKHPDVIFLIIGKTHPEVVKHEGENYRTMLQQKVQALALTDHIRFVNQYLPLPELLEYLQLTDVYLFTSKDQNQAVSGTFSYALSCGCPVVSTAIPHACEVLKNETGIIIDFEKPDQISDAVIKLLDDDALRNRITSNALHRMASTAWENAALSHALVFEKFFNESTKLQFKIPPINYDHIKKMTTDFGIIQFSIINQPDINSGYTIDDNARALVAFCQHYEITKETTDLHYIKIYLNFIKHCQQQKGNFLNYVNEAKSFTKQNNENLEDSNGRAIWAVGYTLSHSSILSEDINNLAQQIMQNALINVETIYSTRAMAFTIKGIYYAAKNNKTKGYKALIKMFADRLVQMYRHESNDSWNWFESYLTYGNSILPESLLCAWLATGDETYKLIAKSTFDFLLSKTFTDKYLHVISNKGWLHKDKKITEPPVGGEQPIDVAYTILALNKFYINFKEKSYQKKIEIAFNWFLGANHLHQIIYNPCTGGCYDGLEENYVNLNQGAESTVSYAMARLTVERLLLRR